MSSVGESSRSTVTRAMSHRVGVNYEEASKMKTVRRSDGKRAGSEANASVRSRNAPISAAINAAINAVINADDEKLVTSF